MKTMVSILVVLATSLAVYLQSGSSDDHRSCNCSGTFCSCTVSCLDNGEIPSCVCGVFSCTCVCHPKDQVTYETGNLPEMNPDQEANSIKAEQYFRAKGGSSSLTIANGIKGLREAIKSQNLSTYQQWAQSTESTYSNLSAAEKSAFESWAGINLKK